MPSTCEINVTYKVEYFDLESKPIDGEEYAEYSLENSEITVKAKKIGSFIARVTGSLDPEYQIED